MYVCMYVCMHVCMYALYVGIDTMRVPYTVDPSY